MIYLESFWRVLLCAILIPYVVSAQESVKQKVLIEQYMSKGIDYYQKSNYSLAIEQFKKVLDIESDLWGLYHIETANSYKNIGTCYECLEKYKEALAYYKKEIAIKERLLPKNDYKIEDSYNIIAFVYKSLGRYKLALAYNKKSLQIEIELKNKSGISISLNNIAEIYRLLGDIDKAYDYYTQAIKIKKEIYDEFHPKMATIYSNLGGLYHLVGDYENALKYHKQSLKIRQKSKKRLGESYNNIGRVYQSMQEYQKALAYYQLSLKEKLTTLYKSEAYRNIADTYTHLKEYDKALINAQISLKLIRKIRAEKSIASADRYETFAKIYYAKGDYEEALRYDKMALDIRELFLSDDSVDIGKSYYNIGKSLKELKRYAKSMEAYKKAFDIFTKSTKENYPILDNKQKKGYNRHYHSNTIISNMLELSSLYSKQNPQKADKIIKDSFNRWLNYKGTISNIDSRIAIVYNKIKELKNIIDNKKRLKVELSTKYQTYPNSINKIKKDALEKTIRDIKTKISLLEIKLNRADQIFDKLSRLKNINYRNITSGLKRGQIYIDFVRGDDSYFIFTIDKEKNITLDMISVADTKILEREIRVFREINVEMTKKDKDVKILTQKSQKSLNIIYKILIKYLSIQLNKFDYLIISPDGLLNFLPFYALYDGDKYIIKEKTITYIPSAKEFVQKIYQKDTQKKESSKVVVFAHPDYDLDLTHIDTNSSTKGIRTGNRMIDIDYVSELNGSIEELNVLQKLHTNIDIYTDENATVENLLKVINPHILHISTHGFFLENISPNYMQQSALILAGGNNAKYISDTRGIITALKISTMELSDTDLVVLSACDTGVGKLEISEGVAGLSKAFIQAGARNIIMSLWSVDDAQTANLMKRFYTIVNKSEDKEQYIESLRKAKLEMIDMHPYYWSSFILSGV